MDAAAFLQLISVITKAIDSAGKLKNLEIRDALIAAKEAWESQREANIDLREKNSDQQEQIAQLKEQVKILEKQVDLQDRVKKQGANWLLLVDDEDSDARYCLFCWEKYNGLFTLYNFSDEQRKCKNCENVFGEPSQHAYKPTRYTGRSMDQRF
jgi:hypothetical protein